MAYMYEIGEGHRVYLDQQRKQTYVASTFSSVGQQQHSNALFTTGDWLDVPRVSHTRQGIFITLTTEQGAIRILIKGQNIQIHHKDCDALHIQDVEGQEVDSIPDSPSMENMAMGDMHMGFNPMHMQMGNMTMHMHHHTSSVSTSNSFTQDIGSKFCIQCGKKAEIGDRFCSGCGHALR